MNHLDRIFNGEILEFSKLYFSHLKDIFDSLDLNEIEIFSQKLLDAREKSSSIFFIGNGGSAATASHFANDISIGTRSHKKPFRAISLTDNQAIITAIGNDYGYQNIFIDQIKNYANPGDFLVAISASGNSENLINSIEYCNKNGINTFSITSFDGGILKKIANNNLHVPTEKGEYGPAEDVHMIIAGLVGSYLIRYVREENS